MSPDGIQFLDMGERFWAGDPSAIINGLWSPLYPFLLGLTTLLPISPYWEFACVHVLGFLILLVATYSAHRLLRVIIPTLGREDGFEWQLWALAYAIVTFGILQFVSMREVTPDVLMIAFCFLALERIINFDDRPVHLKRWLIAGVFLGLGYWTKTVMFPLSLVILASAAFSQRSVRGPAAAACAFCLLALPLVSALSAAKGRLTIGDSGRLNYLWFTNQLRPRYYHWQGDQVFGTPVHSTRQIHSEPSLFEYEDPFRVTHPPTFAHSYWYEGAQPHFNLAEFPRALANQLTRYYQLFLAGSALLLVLGAFAMTGWRSTIGRIPRLAPLVFPALSLLGAAAIAGGAMRTMAVAWILLMLALLVLAYPAARRMPKDLLASLVLSLVCLSGVQLAWGMQSELRAELGALASATEREPANRHWLVAEALGDLGLRAGDPVAVVGSGSADYWARLARLRIVAGGGNKGEDAFWGSTSTDRKDAIAAYSRTSAKVVVVHAPPAAAEAEAWRRLGSTRYWFHPL